MGQTKHPPYYIAGNLKVFGGGAPLSQASLEEGVIRLSRQQIILLCELLLQSQLSQLLSSFAGTRDAGVALAIQ